MASFIVTKKTFELSSGTSARMLVGTQHLGLDDTLSSNCQVLKKHFDYTVEVSFNANGGSVSPSSKTYVVGKAYGDLPTPTKASCRFDGWFDAASGGNDYDETDVAAFAVTQLYAHWTAIDFSNGTEYDAVTTSSYKKTGIYSATRYSSTSAVYVDWGDGSMDEVDGNISQLAHEYSSAGTFRVRITDNITNFAASGNNSTWYDTTSQNRYTFKNMVRTGSRCTSMPTYAFYYCSALSSINFLSSCWTGLASLPTYAFGYCTSLTQLSSLPVRITTLGQYCFSNCTGLTGIQDLRNTGLTSLYNTYTFYYCSNVREWKLPSSLAGTYFGSYLFRYNSNLSAIELPSSLTSISQYCFGNDSQLKNITIPSKVTNIGNNAFYSCFNLSSVTYETTALTSIGQQAFYSCYSLRDINVPQTVKSIGNYAFYGCYSSYASALALPSALTSLGTYAYQYCYNLKTLSIPSSLASIGDYAFTGCRALSSIADTRLTAQTVGANTFGNVTGSGANAYAGYNTRGSNVLSVYWAAAGYDSGYWLDPLQNNDKCGYSIQYLDPENVPWCQVSLDARACGEIGGSRYATATAAQGKKFASLPEPDATADDLVFDGWYTGIDGTGTKYEAGSTCPSQDSLQLYAHWLSRQQGAGTISYDMNEQWSVDEYENPDSGQFYGMFYSSSNCGVDSYYAKMYVYTDGVDELTLYIRSYAESSYDYTVAMVQDYDIDDIYTQGSGSWYDVASNSYVASATKDNQNSSTSLDAYTPVTYHLGGGSHTICIAYGKDSSVSDGADTGYLLVPKGSFSYSTYDTHEIVGTGNGAALALEGGAKVVVLEQY